MKKKFKKIFILLLFFPLITLAWDEEYINFYQDFGQNFCKENFSFEKTFSQTRPYLSVDDILSTQREYIFDPEYRRSKKDISDIKDSLESIYELPIYLASNTYKNNMDDLYKCGVISIQEKVTKEIEDKVSDNSFIAKIVSPVTKKQKNLLEKQKTNYNCFEDKNENLKNSKTNKKNILQRWLDETCRYNFYMEYLKRYYSQTNNLVGEEAMKRWWTKTNVFNQSIPTIYKKTELWSLVDNLKWKIDLEIQKSDKVFPIAFDSYLQYESNYRIHKYLELLGVMLDIYRTKLYKSLSPINQVIYKIINAMWKS